MIQFKKIMINLTLVVLSVLATLMIVLWASEYLFFDKFYYQKSLKHGYWVPGQELSLESFDERAKDVIELVKYKNQTVKTFVRPPQNKEKIDDGIYTVAIIGDSFVWGQGLRYKDRFAVLLEKKLQQHYPTQILSLANCGDSIIDNYIKYYFVENERTDIDLYIFGLVDNDMMFNENDRYNESLFKLLVESCSGKPIFYDPTLNIQGAEKASDVSYGQAVLDSFQDQYANYCVFKKLVNNYLPIDKTIYFSMIYGVDDMPNDYYPYYLNPLKEKNYFIIDIWRYVKKQKINPNRMFVSKKDGHPSRFMNKIYAQLLYDTIIKNPRFGFPSAINGTTSE